MNKNLFAIQVNQFSGSHPGFVKHTLICCLDGATPYTFSSAPLNTLRPPYSGLRSQCGVQVTDVLGFAVGNSANILMKNKFVNLDAGVIAYRTNLKVYNCEFEGITAPVPSPPCFPVCPIIGEAIHVEGLVNYGSRFLIVGGPGNFQKNKFLNCSHGITVSTFYDVTLTDNEFTNTNFNNTNVIGGLPVYVTACSGRTILISRNTINDAVIGINLYVNTNATITVDHNSIDLTNSNPNQNARGIWIQELTPNKKTIINVVTNSINQMRYGIWIVNLWAPQIINNYIYVYHQLSPTTFGSGILTQGCVAPFIQSNTAESNIQLSEQNYWVSGIRTDLSDGAQIQCNTTRRIGDGLFSSGPMPFTEYKNNIMDKDHYRGFVQNFGYIGPQGAPGSPNDNTWDVNGTNFSYHTYCYNSSQFLNFYVRNPQGSSYWPNGMLNATNLINTVIPIGTAGTSNISCPAFRVRGNQSMANSIAGDSILFPNHVAENRTISKLALYRVMNIDTSLWNSNDLVVFWDSVDVSSIGMLDSVGRQVSYPMSMAATTPLLQQNNAVAATDSVEIPLKEVTNIALNNFVTGAGNYSESDVLVLRKIASLCPYTYGPAVYEARVILSSIDPILADYFSDCEIPQSPNSAQRVSDSNAETTEATEFRVYPNPATGVINIQTTSDSVNGAIFILYDVLGRQVIIHALEAGENNFAIDVMNLPAGIYTWTKVENGNVLNRGKIIINQP